MKKSDFTGTGKVFSFTLQQYLKSKETIGILITMVLMSGLFMFILGKTIKDSDMLSINISKIYIVNETDIDITKGDIAAYSSDVGGLDINFDISGIEEAYALVDSDPYAAAVHIYSVDGSLNINTVTSRNSKVNMFSHSLLYEAISGSLSAARLRAYGIDAEQLNIAFAPFTVERTTYKEYLRGVENEGLPIGTEGYFMLSYFYAIIVLMLIMFSATYIIRTVVDEKASKLVELLMVSVRPLALLTGKILATMLFMLISITFFVAGAGISSFVVGKLMDVSFKTDVLEFAGINLTFAGQGILILAIMLISIILAYFTFSILAGISGACCSTTEDINVAMTVVVILAMLGYMSAFIAPLVGSRVLLTVLSLVPVISVFFAPVCYASGVIGIWVLIVSWLLQAITIVFLASFCARVYASLIIHRGTRVKLLELFRIARSSTKKA